MSIDKVAKELISTMKSADESGTKPYDTPAKVLRIEGDTAWVHIPGGVDETPVALTVNAKAGDTVQVRVSGGRAFIIGNVTAPPTDDTKAEEANTMAKTANTKANKASEDVAELAKKIGGNDNQYFWHVESGTDTGSHITEIPKDSFISDPQGNNILIRSNGIAIRDAMDEVAIFAADGAQIGQEANGQTRSIIAPDGMRIIRRNNGIDYPIVNLGYGLAKTESGSMINAPFVTLGTRVTGSVIGMYSVAEGYGATASGAHSHAEGETTTSGGASSHAEGHDTEAVGDYSHAEGLDTYAPGRGAHAEGWGTAAVGIFSHAEGTYTRADGEYAHAEGAAAWAQGDNSHAEGYHAEAVGDNSHAEGYYTTACGNNSHVQGRWNTWDETAYTLTTDTAIDPDKTYFVKRSGMFVNVSRPIASELNTYYEYTPHKAKLAFIVGNGADSQNLSNALDVDWDGNIRMALDTTASTGTIDGDLYKAITDLSWEGDVIDA